MTTCQQAVVADHPDIIKTVLGYPTGNKLVCDMALGYADTKKTVNLYHTAGEPVDSYTRFFS